MPHPIIEISELTQLVVDHLLLLDGQQSLVSLACTCRALEEQAFSTLCIRKITRIFSRQDTRTPSNHGPCPRLITLAASPRVSVNATFISPIMQFNGLVRLSLRSSCYSTGGCTFSLTDDDIEEIAAALPRLNDAGFGRVCPTNSCRTTTFSLVSFSTHCRNLACLEIHVNTTNLRKDLEFASVDPRLDNLPSFPKRALPLLLSLADAPISISQEDVGPVVTGFRRIFPSLDLIGNAVALGELSARLMDEE